MLLLFCWFVFGFFRDAERFSFNFSSLGDFTATILLLLFLGKIARNGSVCVLRAITAGLCSLGGPTVLHAVVHDSPPCSYSGRKIAVGLTLLVKQDRHYTLYVILF